MIEWENKRQKLPSSATFKIPEPSIKIQNDWYWQRRWEMISTSAEKTPNVSSSIRMSRQLMASNNRQLISWSCLVISKNQSLKSTEKSFCGHLKKEKYFQQDFENIKNTSNLSPQNPHLTTFVFCVEHSLWICKIPKIN